MNRIPLDDYQLETETINPMKERFHRILIALVFTGILYFNVDQNQPQMTQTLLPSDQAPILIAPIAEVALSNVSTASSNELHRYDLCETNAPATLGVTCLTQQENRATFSY